MEIKFAHAKNTSKLSMLEMTQCTPKKIQMENLLSSTLLTNGMMCDLNAKTAERIQQKLKTSCGRNRAQNNRGKKHSLWFSKYTQNVSICDSNNVIQNIQ